MSTVVVTGGSGFIGSALVRRLLAHTAHHVVNVDKLTYAASEETLRDVAGHDRYQFEHADICDAEAIRAILAAHHPSAIMHLAAETHVDRSIDGPAAFVQTNVVGTFVMLSEALAYWCTLRGDARDAFRFVHVSTDEVFGSLAERDVATEQTAYAPRSPYAASKAASDHLAHAWHHTYELPVITTNSSNNYGPYQYPEKLIPLVVQRARAGEAIPVYGTGEHVRDWLYVDDHAEALLAVLERGVPGSSYNIGGGAERRNIDVVRALCAMLDEFAPSARGAHAALITHVADRPGHDLRYALDTSRIARELGWRPTTDFEAGLRRTVEWYLANTAWVERIQAGRYAGERLGLTGVESTR
jgi:dTDP-glucose 4,6-dehydratase